MNSLDLQIALDDIVIDLRKAGKDFDDIRSLLEEEVDRAVTEAQEEEEGA